MPVLLGTWRLPRAYAVAAVLLFTLGLGPLGWNLTLRRQAREARAERDQAQTALAAERAQTRVTLSTWTLAPTGGQPASGQVVYLPERQLALLTVNGLPPLQPGQVYQVWLVQNGQPQSAGVLPPSGETAMSADMPRYQRITITPSRAPPAASSRPVSRSWLARSGSSRREA